MDNITNSYNTVLTIAGSDSGGCAGIQADIKSISANGAFATSAITAITSQNTVGVQNILPIPVDHIASQIESVLSDISVNSVKIGMLHSSEVIETVANTLRKYHINSIVLDPVMITTTGIKLIDDNAVETLKKFLPKATLITPNIPEAEILFGDHKIDKDNMTDIARKLGQSYQTSILLKGGHLEDQNILLDVLYIFDQDRIIPITNEYIETKNTHGTGCSLSSSIAANLALGHELEEAVKLGIAYINRSIISGKNKILGKGFGPIDHFHMLQNKELEHSNI
jgi:hydroxymethylpyrimidine/phosphomethylpyrimidine kinase